MKTPEVKQFIQKHNHLFWYIPEDKKEEISQELLIETILNYGELSDFKELIQVVGFKQIVKVFSELQGRKKLNYYPEIYNFFSLVLKRYEHSNI